MSELFAPLLFLHVLGAIVALGPAFAFPLIGSMGGREPAHAAFATRLTHAIDDRIVLPFILSTAATGAAMIWVRGMPILGGAYRWLLLSIMLYAIALAFSWFVQRPTVLRVIELSRRAAPGPGEPGAPTADPVGPPPELAAAVRASRTNGLVLTALSVAVVFLMVVKPTLGG